MRASCKHLNVVLEYLNDNKNREQKVVCYVFSVISRSEIIGQVPAERVFKNASTFLFLQIASRLLKILPLHSAVNHTVNFKYNTDTYIKLKKLAM
jgi:hypothetical protein